MRLGVLSLADPLSIDCFSHLTESQIIPLVKCQELHFFHHIIWNKSLKWLWHTKTHSHGGLRYSSTHVKFCSPSKICQVQPASWLGQFFLSSEPTKSVKSKEPMFRCLQWGGCIQIYQDFATVHQKHLWCNSQTSSLLVKTLPSFLRNIGLLFFFGLSTHTEQHFLSSNKTFV